MASSDFVKKTEIEELLVIERKTFYDNRGSFREVFHMNELEEVLGHSFTPVQMNHSVSEPNVIRALHAESWNKLVYPVTGTMFAAIVDIREDSKTFGKHLTFEFSNENRYALYIPVGLANSICVVGDVAVNYIYIVDQYYTGQDTRGFKWDDPDVNVAWPIKNPILSDRDLNNPSLRDLFPNKFK